MTGTAVGVSRPADGAAGPFPHLFSPLQVGPVTLKNRIVNSAHQTGFAAGGRYTDRLLAYHQERARGGAGLIVSQATCVTPEYLDLWNADDEIIGQYQALMQIVRPHGAQYFAELWHPGRQSYYSGSGVEIYYAPSPVPLDSFGTHWRVPHELEPAAIREIIAAFGAAARRCREGGLPGVAIHLAHGNLVEQFMSPLTNQRTDEWGGPLENRLRLAREILLAVREAIGPAMALGARVTGAGLDTGEPDELDMLEMAGTIDSWGLLDYFDVTMGHYSDALNTARNIPNMTFEPGLWGRYGKGMKNLVSVPVFLVGRINHPQVAEDLIAGGSCDAVVMARALIADPYLPAKAAAGRVPEIRPCVGAMNCVNHLTHGDGIRCIHNPVVSREGAWGGELPPAAASRRVVVVGGGPGGMECARVAATRGHEVILLERGRALGGQVRDAAKGPGRAELGQITEYLAARCAATGVDVRLATEATARSIRALQPDAVIIATGSRLPAGHLPAARQGADQEAALPLIDPIAALNGAAQAGRRVVVLDEFGDWPGMSVAHALAQRGSEVELVTPVMYPGMALELTNWRICYEQLSALGVIFHPVAEIAAVHGNDVVIRRGFSRAEHVIADVDSIVMVRVPVAQDSLHAQLSDGTFEVHLAGDALAPRGIEDAVYDGQRLGREL
jgi:2,4-dienoyl-CoA reductase-like NADH-dependent reductase (Old Yellow Enzyme family)